MRALPTCSALSRQYSIKLQAAATPKLAGLDSSKLQITKTTTPKTISKPEDLVFGREFTGTCRQWDNYGEALRRWTWGDFLPSIECAC